MCVNSKISESESNMFHCYIKTQRVQVTYELDDDGYSESLLYWSRGTGYNQETYGLENGKIIQIVLPDTKSSRYSVYCNTLILIRKQINYEKN